MVEAEAATIRVRATWPSVAGDATGQGESQVGASPCDTGLCAGNSPSGSGAAKEEPKASRVLQILPLPESLSDVAANIAATAAQEEKEFHWADVSDADKAARKAHDAASKAVKSSAKTTEAAEASCRSHSKGACDRNNCGKGGVTPRSKPPRQGKQKRQRSADKQRGCRPLFR